MKTFSKMCAGAFRFRRLVLALALSVIVLSPAAAQQKFDAAQLLTDIKVLASDSLEGRRAGTLGNRRARSHILSAFTRYGLEPFNDTHLHPFSVEREGASSLQGVNVLGMIEGTAHPDTFIVLSAHYDHLGIGEEGAIYNGADDNASGVAGLLAAAEYFTRNRPRHSIIFAAFDAEEMGLRGARAFVDSPPVPLEQIAMNVNMDMISRSPEDELFAVGTFHYPFLRPYLEAVADASPVHVLFGHDDPDHPEQDDWTLASDHGPFHQAGIPFVYFGVEDHPGYHDPSDEYLHITPAFYIRAVETVLSALETFDQNLDDILDAHAAQMSTGR